VVETRPAEAATIQVEKTSEVSPVPTTEEAAKVIQRETIQLSVNPPDAEILLNGSFVDRGSFTGEFEHGESLTFVMRRSDYYEKRLSLLVRDGMQTSYSVVLEAREIAGSYSVSERRIIGMLAVGRDIIVSADEKGQLTALNINGRRLWSLPTQNDSNAAGFPVMIGDRVYFSGPKEFVIAHARSGSVVHRESLDENSCHLFGRRIVELEERGLYPCSDELRIFDLQSGKIQEQIPIPEGSRMTPAVYRGNVLLVNQKGEFLVIDPVRRGIFLTIPTSAVQPIAGAVEVYTDARRGDLAFFGGRRGTIVCVSLSRKKVLWERALLKDKTSTVFHDLEVGQHGVFVYSEGRLHGLSLDNGQDLFEPIEDLSAPPLYERGRIYYGTQTRQFVVADPVSGGAIESLYVTSRISTRPVVQDGKAYVGTEAGQIIAINLLALR
jgi:outer membrane protein assembly factor BamB